MSCKRECHPLMNLNDLDYRISFQICRYFDIDRSWELLAGEIGYPTSSIQSFELELLRPGGSPTKKLLWDWGSRGGTVKDLYDKLALINKVQSMRLLETIVNPAKKKSDLSAQVSSSLESKSSAESKSDNLSSAGFYDEDSLPVPILKKSNPLVKECNMADENFDMSANKPRMHDKLLGMILDPLQDGAASGESFDRKDPVSGFKGEGAASSPVRSLEHVRSVLDEHGYDIVNSHQLSDTEKDVAYMLMNTKSYTYKELSAATGGFCASNKLGEGKYGAVYYGLVKNTKCAIKRMLQKKANGEATTALQEANKLKALSKYRHEHIVNLYGYAIDNDCLYYVYEYMTNGSLHRNLHARGNLLLTWEQRLTILRGAACGLQFLHTVEAVPIIHGNIKSGNILLDRHFEAKIGDLGLAKQATGGDSAGQKTHITKQTTSVYDYQNKAYHPPEVVRGNGFSVKGDTYSFGVVMFECLSGQEAYDERREGNVEEKFLVDYIQNALHDSPKMDKQKTFQDPKLKTEFPVAIFDILFEMASKCTSEKKKDRPTMVEVYTQIEKWEQDCEGPDYNNLPGSPEKKCMKGLQEAGSIHEHKLTDVGHPSFSPGLKAPPGPEAQTKVPESPIDMLPKDQPLPEAFKLQQEFDLRKECKSKDKGYVNVETITEQIRMTYVSDPKKLEAMEQFDKASSMTKLNAGAQEKKPVQFAHGEPLENTEKFTQPKLQAMQESDFVYAKAKDLREIETGGDQGDWPLNSSQPSSDDYEDLKNKEEPRHYGKIGEIDPPADAAGGEVELLYGAETDLEKEFEEIADKATKSNGSMNEIFDRFHEIAQMCNLMNVPQEDVMGENDEFDIQFDFETESEDSTITDSINNDMEALNSADFNDDELFDSEKQSYVNVSDERCSTVNVTEKVSNMNYDATLEEHQNKLARYQGMTREDSDELYERSAQSDDLEDCVKGQSLPSQDTYCCNRSSQNVERYSSLQNHRPLDSQQYGHGQGVYSQGQGQDAYSENQDHRQMQGAGKSHKSLPGNGKISNIQDYLKRREPEEGHCEEYV